MTTPSIPDLIAALKEHDGAMESPATYRTEAVLYYGEPSAHSSLYGPRNPTTIDTEHARAFAWFGTHRRDLADTLERLVKERDEARETAKVLREMLAEHLQGRVVGLLARIDLARGEDGTK